MKGYKITIQNMETQSSETFVIINSDLDLAHDPEYLASLVREFDFRNKNT